MLAKTILCLQKIGSETHFGLRSNRNAVHLFTKQGLLCLAELTFNRLVKLSAVALSKNLVCTIFCLSWVLRILAKANNIYGLIENMPVVND